jgi:protein SCO1/2
MRTLAHVLIAGALVLTACSPSNKKATDPNRISILGTAPISPLPKVEFTMEDTHGQPFDFRKETDGKITLLYFGYTYCPDVCPLQMATLSAAMKELDPSVRKQIEVVFVTVDPARDTPERLAHWLGSFDTTFIGVRGTPKQIDKALSFYRFSPPTKSGSGLNYTVSHPSLVYAFTPDNRGRGMYGSETTKAIWVHDLNLMAHHDWTHATSAETASASGAGSGGSATSAQPSTAAAASGYASGSSAPGVKILDAYVPRPASGHTAALYLTMLDTSSVPDTLLSVSTGMAESATLHATQTQNGMERMVPLDWVALPPGDTVRLKPGARHVMLDGVVGELRPGSTFPATLIFARAGEIPATVRVVTYADLAGNKK